MGSKSGNKSDKLNERRATGNRYLMGSGFSLSDARKRNRIERVLRHMDIVWPDRKKCSDAYRLYYGLTQRGYLTYDEIGREIGVHGAAIGGLVDEVERRLRRECWKDVRTWPEPAGLNPGSKMPASRVREIALKLQLWRFERHSYWNYVAEVKAAASDLKLSLEDVLEFAKAIEDRAMRRTR